MTTWSLSSNVEIVFDNSKLWVFLIVTSLAPVSRSLPSFVFSCLYVGQAACLACCREQGNVLTFFYRYLFSIIGTGTVVPLQLHMSYI